MVLTGSITKGSCSSTCMSNANMTCCETDLCNAYAQNLTTPNGCHRVHMGQNTNAFVLLPFVFYIITAIFLIK